MWWQLWNFTGMGWTLFVFLHEHPQRIFWYLVRLFESELSKIGNFQSSESFLEAKSHLIILQMIFSSEYQSRRTPFIKFIVIWSIFIKIYLVKMCPNFAGSDSKSLNSCQKIHWICSLGYENLMNFTWYIKKFQNCNHTTSYT